MQKDINCELLAAFVRGKRPYMQSARLSLEIERQRSQEWGQVSTAGNDHVIWFLNTCGGEKGSSRLFQLQKQQQALQRDLDVQWWMFQICIDDAKSVLKLEMKARMAAICNCNRLPSTVWTWQPIGPSWTQTFPCLCQLADKNRTESRRDDVFF